MQMHKWFLAGICAGALATPVVLHRLSLTLLGVEHKDSAWVGDALREKGEIASRTTVPQVLLVGGSNVNYGYSAAQIMREFSVPATNLAVHAGLGRRYIFWDCLRHAKRGDLVVLALEYALYGPPFHDPAERYQAFIYDRAYYEQLAWLEKLYLLGSLSPPEWATLWRSKAGLSGREGDRENAMVLNNRGDQTDNTRSDVIFEGGPWGKEIVDPQFVGDLRDFANALRRGGVEIVLAFPNLRHAEFHRRVTPAFINDVYRAADDAKVKVVGTPEASSFPSAYVYNTAYHLNAAGTQLATRRLVRQLLEAGIELPSRHAR